MASILQIVIVYLIHIYAVLGKNCSALGSYVQIVAPLSISRTLTSAQALFPPYNYYIEPTEVAVLSTDDKICSGSITTDITDKIVAIFPENGINCSYVSRIYAAEQMGAKAVLIVNDDPASGAVSTIIDTNPSDNITPTIPARMIPYYAAISFSYMANQQETIIVEFGCFNATNISSILCVIDTSGDHWWMDGDYQLQVDVTKNGHPVWSKEGYLLVLDRDLFLYLNDGDGQHAWYWAITEDPNMEDVDKIVAKCGTNDIDYPTDCVNWMTTNYYLSSVNTFSYNNKFAVSAHLCSIPDNYLCIQSTRSNLGGLYGSYRQFNKYEPMWFREWVDCDTQSGYLTFNKSGDKGVFYLIDPFDMWYVAECVVTGYSSQEYDEHVALHPEICTEWTTLVDGSLDAEHKLVDPTMSVSIDTCDAYECAEVDIVPAKACMERNSIMHSFLEGDYELTGVRGNTHNTSEYVRTDKLYYDGESVPVYVWYYGEVDDEFRWWVISTVNLTTAMDSGAGSVYAWCASNTISPTNCMACWNFYFAPDNTLHGSWHPDCQFAMSDGECESVDKDKTTYEWPDYLCVRNVWHTTDNGTFVYGGDVDFNALMGGYQINNTLTELSGVPFWWKPPNDYNENTTYIYYDSFFGYWQIAHGALHVDGLLFCMEGTEEYLPTHCDKWYDQKANILGSMFIYSEGCSAQDMLSKSTKEKKGQGLLVAVFIILGILAVFIALYWCCKRRNKTRGFSRPSDQKRMPSADLELGDDMDDDDGNLMNRTTKKGGFDMRPLNVDDDDDDDDLTVDAQTHGIQSEADHSDESSDAAEQLIGETTKGSTSEEGPDLGLTS
eukprot:493084_1